MHTTNPEPRSEHVTSLAAQNVSATLEQTMLDEFLDATKFPLQLFEHREDFPHRFYTGDNTRNPEEHWPFDYLYSYTAEEVNLLLSEADSNVGTRNDGFVYQGIRAHMGEFMMQVKSALSAAEDQDYEGPSADQLHRLLDNGIAGLNQTSKVELKAHLYYASAIVKARPDLTINSPTITFSNGFLTIKATGELYAHHPWLICRKWCTRWSIEHRWTKIASISVSVDLQIQAFAQLFVAGTIMKAVGGFNRLRLDYPILEKIPLEGIANRLLKEKEVKIFDATKFVASIPIVERSFVIKEMALPPAQSQIQIDIDLMAI